MNAPFMTRKMVSDFIKKNRRSPNEEEYKLLQWEATRIIIKNNSVGIKPKTEEEFSKIQREMEMSVFDRYGIKKEDFKNEKIQN